MDVRLLHHRRRIRIQRRVWHSAWAIAFTGPRPYSVDAALGLAFGRRGLGPHGIRRRVDRCGWAARTATVRGRTHVTKGGHEHTQKRATCLMGERACGRSSHASGTIRLTVSRTGTHSRTSDPPCCESRRQATAPRPATGAWRSGRGRPADWCRGAGQKRCDSWATVLSSSVSDDELDITPIL
jgi:hypothetical protein